ncbi:hypothetical protein Tco_0635079 [Tanacetum coccineum]
MAGSLGTVPNLTTYTSKLSKMHGRISFGTDLLSIKPIENSIKDMVEHFLTIDRNNLQNHLDERFLKSFPRSLLVFFGKSASDEELVSLRAFLSLYRTAENHLMDMTANTYASFEACSPARTYTIVERIRFSGLIASESAKPHSGRATLEYLLPPLLPTLVDPAEGPSSSTSSSSSSLSMLSLVTFTMSCDHDDVLVDETSGKGAITDGVTLLSD